MIQSRAEIGLFDDIIIDSFAGGGGASTGIELATGHPVDIAINHSQSAIMMHMQNHPYTEHYREDIWKVDPVKVARCGNAVCPAMAEAMVRANLPEEYLKNKINTMERLHERMTS